MLLVDTNILAYLMIQGDRTSAAQELFARDSDWRSESFILVEFLNILSTYVRIKAMTREVSARLLTEAHSLLPNLTNVLHAAALETAVQFSISAYDARFITLARQLRVKLVTEDVKLRAAAPGLTCSLAEAGR
jgi:predicted nucleic acid-binding protein